MPKPNVAVIEGSYSADSISVANCEHGSVYIRLHDRSGRIFAFGCVDRGTALALNAQITEAIDGTSVFRCDSVH